MDPVLARIEDKINNSIQRYTRFMIAPQVIFVLFDEHAVATDRRKLASALSALPHLLSLVNFLRLAFQA